MKNCKLHTSRLPTNKGGGGDSSWDYMLGENLSQEKIYEMIL